MHRRPVYIYLLNVPSFSSRYFNKIKRTSRLGRLLALSLEILYCLCLHFITNIESIEIIYKVGDKIILYFIFNHISNFVDVRNGKAEQPV